MTADKYTKKKLGDFEIIRELGRGGMGIVYEARQVSLNRKVALKVISGSLGLSSKAVLRFQREAEAAGKLHHTNIVPIYSTGNDDGAHYYAMELIDGPSLHHVIRSLRSGDREIAQVSGSAATMAVGSEQAVSTGDSALDSRGAAQTPAWVSEILGSPPVSGESTPVPRSNAKAGSTSRPSSGSHLSSSYFDTVATMIAGVADGLDYAHENGVIHRDIKPANLLLSRDGRVSINDFGLARMLEQPGMTMTGEFVGSPLYMSPEQITAGRAPLDHRTDVYSLGTTLYELLSLKPPFPGRSRDEVIAQILHKDPIPPRRQTPKVPVDLETICLKAMEKDPDRRYQTAGQLAEDLRRFVSGHAISARRVGPLARGLRWAKRNKAVTAMACFTLAVAVGAAAYVYILDRAHRRDEAKEAALFAAMSGRSVEAIEEIQRARDLGAKTSWADSLLGQVDMFEGQSEEALRKFEAAAERDSASVMAQSMLAGAYMANGLWDDYVNTVEKIEILAAEGQDDLSAEDLLFKGIALVSLAPEQALQTIVVATRKRPSFTLAKVWRANVRTMVAQKKGDTATVLDALEDFEYLLRDDPELEGNPLFSDGRLNARIAAYVLLRREEESERADSFLVDARADVEHLARFPHFAVGNWRRLNYYEFTKNLSAMTQVIEEMETIQGYLVGPYGASFFGIAPERSDEALQQIEKLRDQKNAWTVWTRILLQSLSADGRRKADEFLGEYMDEYPRDSRAVEDIFSVLFIRGLRSDALEYVKDRVRRLRSKGSKYLAFVPLGLDYLGGGSTEESDLMRFAGESESNSAFVHFVIGLRYLLEGRREEAKRHFKTSGESAFYGNSMSTWSRALRARLERDPTWPDWLSATPVDFEAK